MTTTDTEATTEHNARRMSQLLERLRDRRSGPAFEQLKQLNLSLSHRRALRLLAPDRVMSMKGLAEELEMTPPSVTTLARRLMQTDLVQRAAHAADNRVVLLSLTPAGRQLHDELLREHQRSMVQLLQGLSPAEQGQFLDLLERGRDNARGRGNRAPWQGIQSQGRRGSHRIRNHIRASESPPTRLNQPAASIRSSRAGRWPWPRDPLFGTAT